MNKFKHRRSVGAASYGVPLVLPARQRLRRVLIPVFGAISLGLANAAYADRLEAGVGVAAGTSQSSQTDSASNVSGDPTAFASTFAVAPGSPGTLGSASSRAEAGSLGLSIRAASSGGSVTKVDASALFRDSLLVSAPGLAFGTPVMLFFDLTPPPAGAIGVCNQCFTGFVRADLNLIFGVAIRDQAVTWAQGLNGASRYSGSFTSNLAHVGDTVSVEGVLTAQVVVGGPAGNADYSFDILNTVPFFAQSQTAGVTLISESGHDYRVTPVPEPGTGLLAAFGLAVVWASTRRRGLDRMWITPLGSARPSSTRISLGRG